MAEMKNIKVSDEKAMEELRLFNNQISYVWELQDLGERADLTTSEKNNIRAFLPNLETALNTDAGPAFTRRLSGIDSVLKACYLLKLTEKAPKYRAIMMERLEQEKLAPIKEYTAMEIDYFDYSLRRLASMESKKVKTPSRSSRTKNVFKKNTREELP